MAEEKKLGLCLDKGYDYDEVRELVEEFGFTAHIRSRGEEETGTKKKAGEKARCRVVERTRSWMNRFRCILVRWEKGLIPTSCHVALACGIIILRATGLLE